MSECLMQHPRKNAIINLFVFVYVVLVNSSELSSYVAGSRAYAFRKCYDLLYTPRCIWWNCCFDCFMLNRTVGKSTDERQGEGECFKSNNVKPKRSWHDFEGIIKKCRPYRSLGAIQVLCRSDTMGWRVYGSALISFTKVWSNFIRVTSSWRVSNFQKKTSEWSPMSTNSCGRCLWMILHF